MANEQRLIDANALGIGKAKREAFDNPAYADGWNSAIAIIENAPTVDAVEVVHGRWVETLVPDGYVQKASRMRKQCSVCGWTNACRYRYCPSCGAKMDGGNEDVQISC